jgi:hypothetical protein
MLIAAARGPLTRRKVAGASLAPTFHQFALEFSDIGGASKAVSISGVAGDLWIGFVQMSDSKTINNPSGWSSPIVDVGHAGNVNFKMKVWWRVLTGSRLTPCVQSVVLETSGRAGSSLSKERMQQRRSMS